MCRYFKSWWFENKNHRNTFLKYERFFRNLETQLHDRWTIKSSNFENNYSYKKNKDFIKDLEDDISQKIFEQGGSDNSKTDDVSDELSKLLSIGMYVVENLQKDLGGKFISYTKI